MVKGAGSGEVELFAWARRRGPWGLGRVAEIFSDDFPLIFFSMFLINKALGSFSD